MSQPLIFNTKTLLPGFQDGDDLLTAPYQTFYHKLAKCPARRFPCEEFLTVLWAQDTVTPDQRVSLGQRRRLVLSAQEKIPAIEAPSKLGEAFFLESGIQVDERCFKDEIEMLIKSALRVEAGAGEQVRSASMRNPNGGYKTTVHIQEKPKVGCPVFCKMEILAVCVTVVALTGDKGEGGAKDRPLIFGCVKRTVFRIGGLGLKWAVDLKPDGRPRRRWAFKGLRGAKGSTELRDGGKVERGVRRKGFFSRKMTREEYGSDEEKPLLME